MFQNYNFSIDTQANLDEADFTSLPFAKNLALDHYNCSPSSLECSPQQEEDCDESLMDNSFQQSFMIKHSQDILKASQQFLMRTSSVGQRGFDDNSIYSCFTSTSPAKGQLLQIVKANQLFKSKQRKEFISELQHEGDICTLLVELMVLFNHHVFNEVTYAIFKIWSSNYKQFKSNQTKKQSLFPSFCSFNGFEQEEQFFESGMAFNNSNFSAVSNASEEGVEKIVDELFNSKKLKYINLQEIRSLRGKRTDAKIYFSDFLKVISKAVFLSAEGIYEETTEINSFSEQELDNSKFSQGQRFTRLFSQTQEDGEQVIPTQESKKRVKLC